MPAEPPARLDYRSVPGGNRPRLIGGVLMGVLAGSLLSFVAYWLGTRFICVVPVVVLAVKVFFGTQFRSDERTRGVAIGVLLSIATGALIFFGICTSDMSFH